MATQVWEGERKVGVRVRLPSPVEGDIHTVGRLEIPIGDARLPLASLAHIRVESGRTQINREQGQRFLALKCNIEGRDMGSFVAEAQSRVASRVRLPEGYRLTWGGEFENQRRAMKRLQVIVPLSVLLIFFLLYMTFRATLPAVVVLLDIPFAVLGGVLALYVTGTELSVSSAVGFITLFGVSVMNGVLIVTYLRRATAAPGATEESHPAHGLEPHPSRADDRAAGVGGPAAGRAGAHHRLGHAAAVRHRHRRRPASGDPAHHAAAAGAVQARRSLVRRGWRARHPEPEEIP